MPSGDRILIFTKAAVPGKVKSRLVPHLTPQEAADFQLAALKDVISIATALATGSVALYLAGESPEGLRLGEHFPGLELRIQEGVDLGERLANAFAASFASGARRTLITGSDHPTLPPDYLMETLELLDSADVALGPSHDGGYYAVALHRAGWPRAAALFERIEWSTPQVLETTRHRAERVGLSVALSPEWYDVDRPEDLDLLRRDARSGSAVARFLDSLGER